MSDRPEAELEDAAVRTACEQLIFRSFELIDGGRATQARELFVADGCHVLDGDVARGPGLANFFEDREAMIHRQTRHALTNMRFEREGNDSVTIRYTSVVYVLPQPVPGAVADITDHLVYDGGAERWLLAHRNVDIVAGGR